MHQQLINHQFFDNEQNKPFHIYTIRGDAPSALSHKNYQTHWHNELELVLPIADRATHFIDGKKFYAEPYHLIIINSGSLHSIIPNKTKVGRTTIRAIVVLISYSYLLQLIPALDSLYFVWNEQKTESEMIELMQKIGRYAEETENSEQADLYTKGLIHLLLHCIVKEYSRTKDLYLPLKAEKNLDRLKQILLYIQVHYQEPLVEKDLAQRFHFSPDYFSRYFHKSLGVTFVHYVTAYRFHQAKKEIVETDHRIVHIAFNHGFTDSRSLIIACKKSTGLTPLHYRKQQRSERENDKHR